MRSCHTPHVTTDRPAAALLEARAKVLHDLEARDLADASVVSTLEASLTERKWWLEQWEEGAAFVPGLVAQDVQDALLDADSRWPRCDSCAQVAEHSLGLEPALGADPHWVCHEAGLVVAALGGLT